MHLAKQFSLVIFSLLLAFSFSSVQASEIEDSRFFIGFDLGTSLHASRKATVTNSFGIETELNVDADNDYSGLYFAFKYADNRRFMVSFTDISATEDDSNRVFDFSGIDFDWVSLWGQDRLKPYLAGGLGLYTFENTAAVTVENKDLSGIGFNIFGGVKFEAHKHVEFDVSYRYKLISWQKLEDTSGNELDLSESMGFLNIGAAVKF